MKSALLFCGVTNAILIVVTCNSPNAEYWQSFDTMRICNSGKKQSPIDIKEKDAEMKTGSKIKFMGYDTQRSFVMKNTGKSLKLVFEDSNVVANISSQHLSGDKFQFAELHFHWGKEDLYGSEHLLDGFQAPIEVHLVHFNTKYGSSIGEALTKTNVNDNLAVLGTLFDITPCDNMKYNAFITELKNVQTEGSKKVVQSLTLESFLPRDNDRFFSYEGSLTTPRCQEVVEWTVFKERSTISQKQLNEFRKLMANGHAIVNNYRSVQPLNGRKVAMYT